MSTNQTLDVYPVQRMQRLGSIVVVQPWWDGKVAGHAFTCDLETGTLALSDHPPIEKDFTPVFGVLGMATFGAGPALVVVTAVEEAAQLRGHPLFRVSAVQVLADTGNRNWKSVDYKYLEILTAGVDPNRFGHGMHFSFGGDPTLTQQRYDAAKADAAVYASTPAWKRAEPAFFWNQALAKPLLEAGMGKFVPTVFVGFVQQLKGVDFSRGSRQHTASITLIARRSARRAGTRQWRRGLDLDANVANFAESEQLVSFDNGGVVASFVQVRGSIPLLWSQSPNLKYKIPIRIAAQSKSEAAFGSHIRHLSEKYGRVTAVNLANQTGREGKLSAAYAAAAATLATELPDFRLVPFDFHKQCGATNYANLEVLWRDIAPDFSTAGYYFRNDTGAADTQVGVFRTNCIDTLDRTNVVQGLLARRALEAVLGRLGLLSTGESLAVSFPAAEMAFRVMWADHGDEISRQYAGTGAMKSAFTRTGKRDLPGLIDDGKKSLTRYYLNNFRDGAKQDALDLVTGAYTVAPGKPAPFRPQGSPFLPLMAVVALLAVAMANARQLASAGELLGPRALQQVVLFLVLAFVLVKVMFRFGKQLVNTPDLRPELSCPWL